jgi:hypothetical protein
MKEDQLRRESENASCLRIGRTHGGPECRDGRGALASSVLALNTFAKYREAVDYLADRQAQVLVTTSRLLQQSEGMLASTAMLLLADDHLARRQAMFEIADRKEWIGRLVEDLAEEALNVFLFMKLQQAIHKASLGGVWENAPIPAVPLEELYWK